MADEPQDVETPWEPPEGGVVTEDRNYIIWVDGVRYEHVSEAPDGRWVYARS